MKPRSKKERRIAELAATLPTLRPSDEEWINKSYKRSGGLGCGYYVILERCKDYQVIRYYFKTLHNILEVMQIWINENEEFVVSRPRLWRVDGWLNKPMQFRHINEYAAYSYMGDMRHLPYCGAKVRTTLPILHRAGLRTSLHRLHPYNLCKILFRSNRAETLFKLRQYTLVFEFYSRWSAHTLSDETIWQAIRVAMRHGFQWKSTDDAEKWCKMIKDLEEIGLDTRNPHYICPDNLKEAQVYWHKRRVRFDEAQAKKLEREKILAYEPTFKKNRERFFDMVFRDKDLEIKIIPTATGIMEEGEAMHHCVARYYNHVCSLILSARVDGERVETIEVNLNSYTLVQSRGILNKSTIYHKRIENLILKHMDEIKQRNEQRILKKAI